MASNVRQTLPSGAVSTKINSIEKIMNTLQAELAGVQRELAKAAARQAGAYARPHLSSTSASVGH